MKLFDHKFWDNKTRYILQCGLATLSVFIVLLILDAMSDTAIIASLGASSFISFTMPEARSSHPRFLIGGYVMGITAGTSCRFLSTVPFILNLPFIQQRPNVVFGALAVGLAIFMMVVTNTEHPPAAGLALGLVLNTHTPWIILVVLIGIISIATIKTALRPVLKNLL